MDEVTNNGQLVLFCIPFDPHRRLCFAQGVFVFGGGVQGKETFLQEALGGFGVFLGAQEDLDGLPEGVLVGGVDGQDLLVFEQG